MSAVAQSLRFGGVSKRAEGREGGRKEMLRNKRSIQWSLPIIAVLFVVACEDPPVSPGVQPEGANLTDNFQFQVTSMANHTQTLQYTWENTGTQANVDQSCAITGGAATLVLLDANGTQVYSRSLIEGGSMASDAGVAGTWTIRVIFSTTDGNINFRAQKRT